MLGAGEETMSNCNRCGKHLNGFFDSICQECESIERERNEDREREEEREEQAALALERAREQSREDIAAAAVYIADAKNNPGDYICPSCLYQTLKKGASRCPKCHTDPGRQYWIDVETEERDARLRAIAAAEEWERGRPAREVESRKKAAIEKRVGRWSGFWVFYFAYLLPSLMFTSLSFFVSGKIPSLDWNTFMMYVPGLNWLATLLVLLFSNSDRLMVFYGLISWAILGGVLWFITKPNTKIEVVVSAAEAAAWERGREGREQRAKNKAFVSAVVSNAFGFGWGGAILGVFVGFGKGCSRFNATDGGAEGTNRYGHINFLEPFWYIPETALYVFIFGAIIGIIFSVIKGQK